MVNNKISEADEKLIRANVMLCLKCEDLTKKISELEDFMRISNIYGDMMQGIAQRLSKNVSIH